ncbi:hypothetical protein Lrub_2233 [Legionella rubrilucens]|uniref:Uncharacterized protein n=1 Tax=Legionella rubrilucens TaxID=458 RepID=A0A0W0XSA4_9GAMM|nr:hypothetical protein Lrub_2233 [Legionella rubrilucens]
MGATILPAPCHPPPLPSSFTPRHPSLPIILRSPCHPPPLLCHPPRRRGSHVEILRLDSRLRGKDSFLSMWIYFDHIHVTDTASITISTGCTEFAIGQRLGANKSAQGIYPAVIIAGRNFDQHLPPNGVFAQRVFISTDHPSPQTRH